MEVIPVKRFLHNVAERFKSVREGRHGTVQEISWDDSGAKVQWASVKNETGVLSFSWQSVLAVDAFKRDLSVVDCICLAFETPEGWIEVNEEMKGWDEFLSAVESSLPGFPPRKDWWRTVAIPAFETNHLRLWTEEERECPE